MKGCLALLALPVVLLAGVWAVLPFTPMERGPLLPVVVSLVLTAAIAFALSAGISIRRLRALKPPGRWEDGDFVGHTGTIQAGESALTSPISGTRCPLYEYQVTRRIRKRYRSRHGSAYRTVTAIEGMGMAPTAVVGDGYGVRLVGFPAIATGSETYSGDEHRRRLVEYLFGATIRPCASSLRRALRELAERLDDEDGVLRHDQEGEDGFSLPDPSSEPVDDADPPALERAVESMRQSGYQLEETVVPEGAEVTVFGRWDASNRKLDIGSATALDRGLFLGPARPLLRRTLVRAVVALLVAGPPAAYLAWKLPVALGPALSTDRYEGPRIEPAESAGSGLAGKGERGLQPNREQDDGA